MSMPSSKSSSNSDTAQASSSSSPEPTTSAAIKDPIPGTSQGLDSSKKEGSKKLLGCSCSSLDDPQPGPSTTAADFDLEVFDSCSSCSLEDCWGVGCPNSSCESSPISGSPPTSLHSKTFHRKGNKKATEVVKPCSSRGKQKICRSRIQRIPADLSDNSSEEDFTMTSPQIEVPLEGADGEAAAETVANTDNLNPCPEYGPASACPSETEEASSEKEEDDLNEDECECIDEQCWQCCGKKADSAATEAAVECPSTSSTQHCKLFGLKLHCHQDVPCESAAASASATSSGSSKGDTESTSNDNIDEIVQDHDNFGTDENEDSLDSSAVMATLPRCLLPSLSDDIPVHASPEVKQDQKVAGGKRKSARNPSPDRKKKRKDSMISKSASVSVDCDGYCPEISRPSVHLIDISELEQEFCSPSPLHQEDVESSKQPSSEKHSSTSDSSSETHMKLIPDKDNPPQEMLDWVDSFSRWSHAQRLLAIDQLIGRCEPTQVRHMMAVIEPQFQRDFISLLPKELALYVLSFLKPKDLLNAAQTCNYWRILAEDNLLWREKCREAGHPDSICSRRRKASPSGFMYSTWKSGFMREHNIECNWRNRTCRNPKILKGHDDHVITCLQFGNDRIVSGSDDNTLKVWNASTGRCLRTLVGHTGGVWSSQMEGSVIVSGSTDRTLKVWNAETGVCEHTLYGHTSTVRCMHLHKNLVVSGSRDATLRMWDITTGECLHVLMGHVAAVRCVQYDGRLVVSGAYDYMVKVWNPMTEECLHTLSGHTNRVYSLQFDGIHVVSGSLDTSIRVWDVETGACKHALMGHQSLTSGMELKDNILVSGNADSTVKVWDITNGQCLQTLSGPNKHQSAVTCLQFNSKFVVTSSDDGTVKLWDVKTGEFIRDLVALKSGGSGGVVWRIRANATKLVCAVGSRNGTEETKLLVLDFDLAESK